MMSGSILKLCLSAGLIIFLTFPGFVYGQCQKGKILSGYTNTSIDYVNVSIKGKCIGTVSDESGIFSINLEKANDDDSLYFSRIGYESKSLLVHHFKQDSIKTVYLEPKCYDLNDVTITACKYKTKEVRLGTEVYPNIIKSGFADNNLGSELGIKVKTRGRVILQNINLNVATCTFDSVTYRLNIYQSVNQDEYKNVLTEPIYISFSKDKINNSVAFDLSKYSIVVEGDVIVALELYKDLGEGKLLFHTNFFNGSTHYRKTNDVQWAEASGEIGMYLHGHLLR